MNRKTLIVLSIFAIFCFAGHALAHTPIFACFDNGDGTIYCEGGFSDGSTAAGVPVNIRDKDGDEIKRLELSRNSDIEFEKPEGDYSVEFDGGPGHRIEIKGSQIFK